MPDPANPGPPDAGSPAAAPVPAAPSAQPLLRHARRLLWWALLPVLALVLLLALWQGAQQWRQLVDGAATEARLQHDAFEAIARDATHHVDDLRRRAHEAILNDRGSVDPAMADALQPRWRRDGAADGWALDTLPELLRGGMGQLMWPQQASADNGTGTAAGRDGQPPPAEVLRRAQQLSAVVEVAHQRYPQFVWSYFFGWPDRHVLIYPWVPSRYVSEDQGRRSMSEAVSARFGDEVFTGALPERNPSAQPYWTAPYVDAGGQGLLVSHAAPVVVAEQLRGMVGTDIRLSTLDALLQRLPGHPWRAWVVDDRGHVLADRQPVPVDPGQAGTRAAAGRDAGAAASGPAAGQGSVPASAAALPPVRAAAQVLPAAIDLAALQRARSGTPLQVADHHLVALRINAAPWTVVLAAPHHTLVLQLLRQMLPYSVMVLGLLALWVVAQALLGERLVLPMVQVFDYLQRLSLDARALPPRLSGRWQPWTARVTEVFSGMREAAHSERRAQALKSAIVDHAQAAVVVTDAQDRIVEFNPAAEAMFGWSRDQVLGQVVRDTLMPERLRATYSQVMQRMRDGDPDQLLGRRLQRQACRADGREFPVEVVLWISRVDGDEFITASLADLTAAKAAAEVIERQRDALRQSEKLTAMGSLLAGVAHELNNPLAIVMGRASLLEDKAAGTPMAADATRIREAAERCGRIVRTFLNMARNKPAVHAPVPLNDLARAAADMLGYTLRSHGVDVDLRLDTSLPPVMADADQIGQVVLNLIVNAQQQLAAQPAPRRITLASGHDEQHLWLSVADNGPGVPEAVRERIFDPFFTTKAEGSGTGLGLSVSRAIVREHGGELLLMPAAAGQGACFRVQLPRSAG